LASGFTAAKHEKKPTLERLEAPSNSVASTERAPTVVPEKKLDVAGVKAKFTATDKLRA
jgi:hypothetical protein